MHFLVVSALDMFTVFRALATFGWFIQDKEIETHGHYPAFCCECRYFHAVDLCIPQPWLDHRARRKWDAGLLAHHPQYSIRWNASGCGLRISVDCIRVPNLWDYVSCIPGILPGIRIRIFVGGGRVHRPDVD